MAAADITYQELLDSGHPESPDIFSYDETSVAELFYTAEARERRRE